MGRGGSPSQVDRPNHLFELLTVTGGNPDIFCAVEGRDGPERHPFAILSVLFVVILFASLHLSVIISDVKPMKYIRCYPIITINQTTTDENLLRISQSM